MSQKNDCIHCVGSYCEAQKGSCPAGHHANLPEAYEDSFIQKICKASANVEKEGYLVWPRLREIMEFAKRMEFHHLGIAFCTGLKKEVSKIVEIFERNGFQVSLALCKMDGHDKSKLGLSEAEKFAPGFEAMCNPIRQAEYLDEQKTQLNVVVGLCVGHDALFYKHTKTLTTTFITKDRALGHNPAAAVYLYDGYLKSRVDLEK